MKRTNMNSGGSYIKDKDGNETKVAGTNSHKDGDRGRDADGNELRKSKKMQQTGNSAPDEQAEPATLPAAKTGSTPKASTKKGDK